MAPLKQGRPCLRLISQRTPTARFCTASTECPHLPSQAKEESVQQLDVSTQKEYNVCKARLHASLWQQEIRKEFRESSPNTHQNSDVASIDSNESPQDASVAVVEKFTAEDWESFVQEEEFDDQTSIKEENMLLEEFERRKEHNRIRIANFVKQHLYSRRRPVDGWKYIVNSFGSENKGTAVKVEDRDSRLSDLEKIALKREAKYRR